MSSIKLFESKQIKSVWNKTDEKWCFVVEDVVASLTDSRDPKQYIKRMRQRDGQLAKGCVQIVPNLLQKMHLYLSKLQNMKNYEVGILLVFVHLYRKNISL